MSNLYLRGDKIIFFEKSNIYYICIKHNLTIMKKIYLPLAALMSVLSSCTYNTETCEQHVSIFFWFFVAAISIGTILILWLIFRKYKKK